LIAINFFDRD